MKKDHSLAFIVIVIVIILGVLFYQHDYKNLLNKREPTFCIKNINGSKGTVNYYCLGYTVKRESGISYKEPINENVIIKIGPWLFTKKLIDFNK